MDHTTVRASTPVRRRPAALVAVVAACAAGPLLLVSPGVTPGAAATTSVAATSVGMAAAGREVVLDLDAAAVGPAGGDGTPVPTAGTVATVAEIRTHASGVATTVRHRGAGSALRLPAFDAAADRATVPVAVLAITPTGTRGLDPGSDDFVFGASVRVDSTSTGTTVDNGDNVVQRGLVGSPAQMKLQVDGRFPACRVKGVAGAVQVTADSRLRAGRWFDLSCRRAGDTVTLVQRGVGADGAVVRKRWTGRGPTGSLSVLGRDVPLTVGGKTDATGAPLAAGADPLNGSVDDIYLDLLG